MYYAKALMELGLETRAAEEFAIAVDLVRSFTDEPLSKFSPHLDLWYSRLEISFKSQIDPLSIIQHHWQLAERAAELGERIFANQERLAANRKARQLTEVDNVGISQPVAYMVRKKVALELLSFASKAGHLPVEIAFGLMISYSGFDAEWLDYYERFCHDFPAFDVPGVSAGLTRTAVEASRRLRNDRAAAEYLRYSKEYMANLPGMKRAPNGILVATTEHAEEVLAMWSRLNGTNFASASALYVARVMILWIHRELEFDTITIELAMQVLKSPVMDAIQFADWLAHVDAAVLRDRIFGEIEPTNSAEWLLWFAKVEEWLKGQQPHMFAAERKKLLVRISQTRTIVIDEFKMRPGIVDVPLRCIELAQQSRQETTRYLEALEPVDPHTFSIPNRLSMISQIALDELTILINSEPTSRTAETFNDDTFAKIQCAREDFITYYRASSWETRSNLFLGLLQVARVIYLRWVHCKSVPILSCLKYMEEADEVFHQISSQRFLLRAVEAIPVSIAMAEDMKVSQLY
ncbi:hypothetical protein B7463_g12019, partial [Scytalidium lignicola]